MKKPNGMPGQLSLAGFDPEPRASDRLFFALYPDSITARNIAHLAQQLRTEHGLKGEPLKAERFHITLHHLGDYAGLPQGVVAAASEAASAVAAAPGFDLAFDRVASFAGKPGNRPFVLRGGERLADLVAFQRKLGEAMKKTSVGSWAEPRFTPHVTLLYDGKEVAEHGVDTVSWTVREFVLVHSLIGQTRHIVLGRWPLQPPAKG
jgi:2'-5' RNA ligase